MILGASPLPYENGCLAVPDGPGNGVELDPERVANYAELFEKEGSNFASHESSTTARTPLMPKF